jgi:hypothetical protein
MTDTEQFRALRFALDPTVAESCPRRCLPLGVHDARACGVMCGSDQSGSTTPASARKASRSHPWSDPIRHLGSSRERLRGQVGNGWIFVPGGSSDRALDRASSPSSVLHTSAQRPFRITSI